MDDRVDWSFSAVVGKGRDMGRREADGGRTGMRERISMSGRSLTARLPVLLPRNATSAPPTPSASRPTQASPAAKPLRATTRCGPFLAFAGVARPTLDRPVARLDGTERSLPPRRRGRSEVRQPSATVPPSLSLRLSGASGSAAPSPPVPAVPGNRLVTVSQAEQEQAKTHRAASCSA